MHRFPIVALVALALALPMGAPSGAAGVAAAAEMTYEDVYVEMSDGVHLVGDIELPDGDGPFPVLLNMTPYGPATYFSHYLGEGLRSRELRHPRLGAVRGRAVHLL